jgi:hypothetical protein
MVFYFQSIRTRTDQGTDQGTDQSKDRGMFNMVAMMNGFGASGFLQFTRRDGSLWPTDHWNFNKQNLHNVARLESKEGGFEDKLHIPYKVLGTPCNTARKPEDISIKEGVNDKQDGIAFDIEARALLICDKGTWLHSRGKGAANWNDYIDVKISADQDATAGLKLKWSMESPKGASPLTNMPSEITSSAGGEWKTTTGFHLNLGLDANQWGMPTVLEASTRGFRKLLEDSWCNFATGPVETAVVGTAVVAVAVQVATWGAVTTAGVFSAGGGAGEGGGPVVGTGLGTAQVWCAEKNNNWTPIAQKPEYQMSIDPNSSQWILRSDMHNGGVLTVRFHKLYQ